MDRSSTPSAVTRAASGSPVHTATSVSSATRLAYWTKQIETVARERPRFMAVPIAAKTPPTSRGGRGVEIEVDGLTLRVGDDIDVRYVAQLVAALQTRGAEQC
jgi:hypothetical protein